MESVWFNLYNICMDTNLLDNHLYIDIYGKIYKYIIESSSLKSINTTIYPLDYYNYFKNNITEIFNKRIRQYEIVDIKTYNSSYMDFLTILDKTKNLFCYFDKRVNSYNTQHYIKKNTYNELVNDIWDQVSKDKGELIDNELFSILSNFRNTCLKDRHVDSNSITKIDDIILFLKFSDKIHTINHNCVSYYNHLLKDKTIDVKTIIFILKMENIIKCNINYDIDLVLEILVEKIEFIQDRINYDEMKEIFKYLTKNRMINCLYSMYEQFLERNIEIIISNGNKLDDICEFYIFNINILNERDKSKIDDIITAKLINLLDIEDFGEKYAHYLYKKCLSQKNLDVSYFTLIKFIKNNEIFQINFLTIIKNYILKSYHKLTNHFLKNIAKMCNIITYYENIDIVFRLRKIIEDVKSSLIFKSIHLQKSNYNILIISDGIWNINYNKTHNNIPRELIDLNKHTDLTYKLIYEDKRKLTHCYNLYNAEVEYIVKNKKYTLLLPYKLVLFLQKFNDNDRFLIDKKDNIKPLLQTKLVIQRGEYYELNQDFKYKKDIVDFVNLKSKKKTKHKKESIYHHEDLIKCFITKYLKKETSANYDNIFKNVSKMLEMRIKITKEDFDIHLNKLIDLDYARLENNQYFYN